MAFTNVQTGPSVASTTGSVMGTLPAPSTAGTLLTACLFNTTGQAFTAPAGWVLARQFTQGTVSRTDIWYYAGNPGGISSVTFAATSGNVRCMMAEFSTAAGTIQVIDSTGNAGAAAPVTSFTVTAGTSSAAGDLGVAAFGDAFTTATTGQSWTIPAGYTSLHNTANFVNAGSASYKLSLSSGIQSVTASYSSSANQTGWSGVFAAFSETAASGLSVATTSLPDGKIGVAYNQSLAAAGGTPPYTWAISAGALPAGLSLLSSGGRGGGFGVTLFMTQPPVPMETATANWQSLVGRPVTCRKVYYQSGQFPTTPDVNVQGCIDLGMTAYLCYKPAYNPPTTSDFNHLQASLQAFKDAGLTAKVILYQEIEDQALTPAQYKAMHQFYEPAVHAVYPGGLCHDSAGSKHLLWASFFPTTLGFGGLIDEYGIDYYATVYHGGVHLDAYVALVAATGKRFATMEMGVSVGTEIPPPDTGPGSVTAYFAHVTAIAAANPPGSFMWYQQDNKNVHNVISDPADFRIPLLQVLSDTVAGASASGQISGTPTAAGLASFTARVTDNNAVTATAALTINVTASSLPVITTLTLPAATVGVAYSQQVVATGGTAPLTFSLTAGALPDGLSLGQAGFIFGTPAVDAATSGFTVTVTDGNNQADAQSLFITVVAAGPPPNPAPNPLGFPQVIIEAGFTAAAPQVPAGTFLLDDPVYGKLDSGNQLGDATIWTDIGGYLRTGSISRPSTRVQGPLITYQGGTASGVFDNTTGNLDPDNPTSPYYGFLRPMVPFRIRAVYGSQSYGMWSGFTSSIAGSDITYDMGYDEVTITGDDGFKILAGNTIPAVPLGSDGVGDGDGEDSGARVSRILNAAGWYTDHRRIDVGDSTVQGTLYGTDALSLLQLTADSEIGTLYIDGSGNVVYRHRQAIILDTRSTQVQAAFGDLPGFTVLSGQNAGFEGGAGTWTGAGNCTVPASSAQAHTGTGSAAMTSAAAGNMTAAHCTAANILTQGLPVTPGQPVAAAVWAFAATAARSVQAGAQFYDSGGSVVGSILYGPAVTDSTTGWTQSTAAVTAPAGAAFCRLSVLVQATGGAAEVHYIDDAQLYYPELACLPHRRAADDTTLANDIQVTIPGGTLQEAQSRTSQRKYLFERSYARTDILLEDDPTALNWAQWVLSVSLVGDDRFDAVTIDPLADPGNLFPQVLGREIGDRIQVWRRPQNSGTTITQDCFIRGIQHDVDAVAGTWSTTWTLQSAARYTGFLILDDPANGLLNTGKLAF